jgi:hypothetical protein
LRNFSGSIAQSTLTELAKWAMGFASIPILDMPCNLASTTVVPVPQNGSSNVSPGFNPKLMI